MQTGETPATSYAPAAMVVAVRLDDRVNRQVHGAAAVDLVDHGHVPISRVQSVVHTHAVLTIGRARVEVAETTTTWSLWQRKRVGAMSPVMIGWYNEGWHNEG